MFQKSLSLVNDFKEDDNLHNRSFGSQTVHEHRFSSLSIDKQVTPLDRFTDAKKKSIQIFEHLKTILAQCLQFLKQHKMQDIEEDLLIQMINDHAKVHLNGYLRI